MRSAVSPSFYAGVLLACVMSSAASGVGPGDTVRVTANLNVRNGPSTNYPEITDPDYRGTAQVGTTGRVIAGPQSASGYTWWRVDFGPGLYVGWAVQDGLQVTASSRPAGTNVTLILYVHENGVGGPLIPGVRVAGRDGAGNFFNESTNANGCVSIAGKPGNWTFAATKGAYQPNSWSQPISSTCRRDAFIQKLVAPPRLPNQPTPAPPTVTNPQQPAAPVPIAPGFNREPGQTIDTIAPLTFRWAAVPGADYYALAVSEHPYGPDNVRYRAERINGASHTISPGTLKPGRKYRWNIQAHSPTGWSPVSNTLSFQTKTNLPITTPQQVTPPTTTLGTMTTPTCPSPWMSSEQIEKAIQWAGDREGRKYTKGQTYENNRDLYYYSCQAFVARAYTWTGTPVQSYASASAAADRLNASQNAGVTPPPRGAWVLYAWATDGHAALSLGDGNVIHAYTAGGKGKIQTDPYNQIPGTRYIGWAWPKPRAGQNERGMTTTERQVYKEKIQKLRRLFADPTSLPQPRVPLVVRARHPELIAKADNLYLAALDYQFLSLRCLRYAENFLETGDATKTDASIAKAQKYYSVASALRRDSQAVANGIQSVVETELEGVRNASQTAVGLGLAVTNPTAAKVVDYIYTGVDYAVERAILGGDEAAKNAAKRLLVKALFGEVKFPSLGNKTLDEYLQNRIGKEAFPVVDGVLKSEEAKFAILRLVKEAGVTVSEEILLTMIPEGGPVSTRQAARTVIVPAPAQTGTPQAKTGIPSSPVARPEETPAKQQRPANEKAAPGAAPAERPTFRQLSPQEQAQAATIWNRVETARRIAANRGLIGEIARRRLVDHCRQINRQFPDSEYAFKAKEVLAGLPEGDRKRYGITDHETKTAEK